MSVAIATFDIGNRSTSVQQFQGRMLPERCYSLTLGLEEKFWRNGLESLNEVFAKEETAGGKIRTGVFSNFLQACLNPLHQDGNS